MHCFALSACLAYSYFSLAIESGRFISDSSRIGIMSAEPECIECSKKIDVSRGRYVKATLYLGESVVEEQNFHESCFQFKTRVKS
jgi:hypothetical protein